MQTNTKPQFHKQCSWLSLGEKFEHKLMEVNVKYKEILDRKLKCIAYVTALYLGGIAVILIGVLYLDYIYTVYEKTFDAYPRRSKAYAIPAFIWGFGATLLITATTLLSRYLNEYKARKRDKKTVDDVLALYKIPYILGIKFNKAFHGVTEVDLLLQYNGEEKYFIMNYNSWVFQQKRTSLM